jgi:hypothetical protein
MLALGLGVGLGMLPTMQLTLIQQAINTLRQIDGAQVYLPGEGSVFGLRAGNYIDSAGTLPGVLDSPVGRVEDVFGGIHASQNTPADKPVLRRGAVNLLTYSQDFANAAWQKARSSAPVSTQTYLDGSVVSHIVEDTTNDSHPIYRTITGYVSGDTRTAVLITKSSVRSQARIAYSGSAFANSPYLDFDLTAETVNGFLGATGSIEPLGGGWYMVCVTVTTSSAGSGDIYIQPRVADEPSYLGTGVSALYLYRAGIFKGTYTAAQIQALGGIPLTTTAPASTAFGAYKWDFDTTDTLSLTLPAGYESATIIDATAAGPVTLLEQDITGTYNIGPSLSTHGRIILRDTPTPRQLELCQGLASRLAGL